MMSPILEAMQRLDPNGAATTQQPSLVRQLYALALLNREDARRRLSNLSQDVYLSQQPPSLLALASPSMTSEPAPDFRSRPSSRVGSRPASRSSFSRSLPPRNFGAVRLNGSERGAGGAGAELAMQRIAAARQPSLALTAVGAPGASPRAQSAAPLLRSQRPSSRFAFDSGTGSHGKLALSVSELTRHCPTRESTIPARRAAERAEVEQAAYRAAREARLATPLPDGRLPVRALLEDPRSTSRSQRPAAEFSASLQAVASATSLEGALVSRQGAVAVRFAKEYVPDPRLVARDPWSASENDLGSRTREVDRSEDMVALRMASMVGTGLGGFGV
jgi:hypothetical protein